MSLFSAAPGAALSSAVQISVCFILTAPIHHSRARRLSPRAPNDAANKATFPRDGCSLAPLLSSPASFCFLYTSFGRFNCLIRRVCTLLSVSTSVVVFSLDFRRFSGLCPSALLCSGLSVPFYSVDMRVASLYRLYFTPPSDGQMVEGRSLFIYSEKDIYHHCSRSIWSFFFCVLFVCSGGKWLTLSRICVCIRSRSFISIQITLVFHRRLE